MPRGKMYEEDDLWDGDDDDYDDYEDDGGGWGKEAGGSGNRTGSTAVAAARKPAAAATPSVRALDAGSCQFLGLFSRALRWALHGVKLYAG
jgi:hypothetical protein